MPPPSSLHPSPLPTGLSVVVPVYNSAPMLPELIARMEPVLRGIGKPFEVILVNDGSGDASWLVVQDLAAKHPFVRGLCLSRNYGQHNATLAGVRLAQYAVTVTMDDDLQHPPDELPRLLAVLTPDVDVVYGTPESEPHGLLRNVASVITKIALHSATGADNARMVSAWRVFRTRLRDAFANYSSPFVSLDVLLSWGTRRFDSLQVRHDPRSEGSSSYTFGKLLRHAANMMTGFSVLPLQLASIVGFGFTLFGMVVLAYVLICYMLRGTSVAGFPFLASIISIFAGAQLFATGIIGEYVARIHFRTMDKPSYSIQDCTDEEN